MIHSIILLQKKYLQYFSRTKLPRRQKEFKYNEKLKDITKSQSFQKQIQQHRRRFQQYIPDKTLSQTLKLQKSQIQLKNRFKVNRQQIQKKAKQIIKKQLKIQRIIPAAENQHFQTLQSKSHLYDQSLQLQFQQKFRKQLFKKKQTKRIIDKQKNDFRNYLNQPKNQQYIEYQKIKKQFKNSKIDSMMNFKRNNQQLRLLIDSGYIDSPKNMNMILKEMENVGKLENKNQEKQISQITQQTTNSINQNNPQLSNTQNIHTITNLPPHFTTPALTQLHSTLMQNIQGPQQLRNISILQQFFQKYQQNNQIEKQKAKKDLQLIKKMKQFQTKSFQSRYNAINFRFKGQVDFGWMKEGEMMSYIKHERNKNTQPQSLLLIYQQNKQKLNKFSQPIITPTVMSRIYSVCSLYQFPQTDTNNRLNMLNDRKYIQLQKQLFKNLHQLPDDSFADAVFAYSRNHKQQQGLLKIQMNKKICQAIFRQLNQRVDSLNQEDLGLVLRSVMDTPILKIDQLNWRQIQQILSQRLYNIQKDYEFQSAMTFMTLIPHTQNSITTVQSNMKKYLDYKWQAKQTLISFLQASSFVIRYQQLLPSYKKSKFLQEIKHLICQKHQQIMSITEKLSINFMPQLLSLLYCLDRHQPLQANYMLQVPQKLINKAKKQIIDNIRMQKQLIKKHTIGNITYSLALIDYCKSLRTNHESTSNQLQVLQISSLKSLFSFRALPFNSINYFTYHQLLKLLNSQISNLPVKSISQTLFGTSLVRYKNQGLFEQILGKLVEKIYYQMKQMNISQQQSYLMNRKYFKDYVYIICTFHNNRIINQYYYQFMNRIMKLQIGYFIKLQPNLLIRLFQSVISLSFTTLENLNNQQDFNIMKYFANIFEFCMDNNLINVIELLTKEEVLIVKYVMMIVQFFKVRNGINQVNKLKFAKYNEIINKRLSIQNQRNTLTYEDKFLDKISDTLQKCINLILNKNQNQNQLLSLQSLQLQPSLSKILLNLQPTQKQFYQKSIHQILTQQQQIGTKFNYQNVYEKIIKKLKQQNKPNINQNIKQKTWRIQINNKKQVYFLVTYQHLLAKYQEKNTTVRMFGIWKVYSQIYKLMGWRFKIVCTFLEG